MPMPRPGLSPQRCLLASSPQGRMCMFSAQALSCLLSWELGFLGHPLLPPVCRGRGVTLSPLLCSCLFLLPVLP